MSFHVTVCHASVFGNHAAEQAYSVVEASTVGHDAQWFNPSIAHHSQSKKTPFRGGLFCASRISCGDSRHRSAQWR